MKKSKKFISVLLAVVMMFTLSCMGAFASDVEPSIPEDAQEMTYMGEVDGVKHWQATIPMTWTPNDGVAPMDNNSSCTADVWYDDYTLYCQVTYSAGDILTSLSGTCETYGVACANDSTSLYASGYSPVLKATAGFTRTFANKRGNQYFEVSGNVRGVNGSGTFGPSTKTLYVDL